MAEDSEVDREDMLQMVGKDQEKGKWLGIEGYWWDLLGHNQFWVEL